MNRANEPNGPPLFIHFFIRPTCLPSFKMAEEDDQLVDYEEDEQEVVDETKGDDTKEVKK